MNTFSDRMTNFAQEVLTRFADELPEETFEHVSDIVLRELQYQQIQEKIYVPLKEFLDALQKNSQTNDKIIKRIDAMLAGNVQQLQRDDKQMSLLQDLKKEQQSFADRVDELNEEVGTTLHNELLSNIKSECSEIVQKISQKMENASVQYNKDNTNISNQIGMLIEIHKTFIEEFKSSDVSQAIEEATTKLENLQKDSLNKVSAHLESIPELIQSEIMEAIDQQEILDSLKEQQNFISNKLEERVEKDTTPSLEESQMLLQPIQDAMLDQSGQLENMLSNIQDSLAELQIQHAEVAEESAAKPQSATAVSSSEDIEDKIKNIFQPLIDKLEDSLLENIRPKDLDTMKKSLSKIMETGFWRIEQLIENNDPGSADSTPQVRKDSGDALKNQLQTIENLLKEKLEGGNTETHSDGILARLKENTQEIVGHVFDDIKTHFMSAEIDNKLSSIDEKLNKMNVIEEKLQKMQDLDVMQEKLDKLQEAISSVDNKVLELATQLDKQESSE
ncbi:hypothetical protein [Candidatus Uabimicrobium amorphum]|uniref:Uncharacterized protein n=1 Tax=Uabimicrobium amorphum TaxID=2596890 RepID=A0A5S9F5Q2_UABAM|nr:hypothetical protein [Candidatus Uabimicrobium amorphum]BBM85804.1 hypothetical protein UABAM_04182 [Candidatus Uabimicrobium amorphum]